MDTADLRVAPGYDDGPPVLEVDEIPSTNQALSGLVMAGLDVDGMVLRAHAQTAGRGRQHAHWISPPGNLYHSYCFRVPEGPARAAELSFVTAVALAEALTAVCPQSDPRCKWPNDLLCHGGKISGILLETVTPPPHCSDRALRVIIGIGVNVASAPTDPEAVRRPAVALSDFGCEDVSADHLMAATIPAMRAGVERWRHQGFGPVRDRWLSRALGLDGPVEARLSDGRVLSGMFRALDADGALILEDAGGQRHRILAADVFFGAADPADCA